MKNLEYLGYEVVHIEDLGYAFKYNSIGQRLHNLLRKVFLKDRSYKENLKIENNYIKQRKIIVQHYSFDIALVIRADFFKKSLIELIRQKTSTMISFHFDGISRNPEILDYVSLFDRFYAFDQDDLKKYPSYNLSYSPNFYLDYPDLIDQRRSYNAHNVYYVSTFHESRIRDLIDIHKRLSVHYASVKFIVVCSKDLLPILPDYVIQHMEVSHEHVDFAEQLNNIAFSDVIIDLVIAEHKGYSLRIIEGLKFGKKVITTNFKVLEAEFYHPHNFFVLQNGSYDGLDEFLNNAYVPIDNDMKKKYSFSEWLNNKLIDK
ncbi:hypothetical protein [Sphingobacterium pedocola]|uniref:hypothetical protein n=1 Tax=Sphingobacterium pedocola TaxID=2082722 RepID=UPI0018CB2D8B|nr:hypothetical protein [Sphingobacterium pedocola]